ncbi:MAG: hypothetical protein ACYTXA_12385 [Nostoc sp.]
MKINIIIVIDIVALAGNNKTASTRGFTPIFPSLVPMQSMEMAD